MTKMRIMGLTGTWEDELLQVRYLEPGTQLGLRAMAVVIIIVVVELQAHLGTPLWSHSISRARIPTQVPSSKSRALSCLGQTPKTRNLGLSDRGVLTPLFGG